MSREQDGRCQEHERVNQQSEVPARRVPDPDPGRRACFPEVAASDRKPILRRQRRKKEPIEAADRRRWTPCLHCIMRHRISTTPCLKQEALLSVAERPRDASCLSVLSL